MKLYGVVALIALCRPCLATMPSSQHVFLVVEENHSYSSVIGNPAMPYLNSLAAKYGLATKYYANTHPSIGNYFMLTTGQIVTNDDSFIGVINVDDVVAHLLSAGKTWKSYAESLPYAGYTGGNVYPYLKRHNPFSYFSDVVNSSQKQNLVPFSQFPTDLSHNQLPNFSFIVPNALNDAHDGTLAQADLWLSQNMASLLASSVFKTDGILILVFDESATSDQQGGGGHVAAVVIGPNVQSGYKSATTYQHPSTLKSLLQALGATSYPGAAQSATDMGEFFVPPPPPPTPDFAISVSPTTANVKAGQAAAFTVRASPTNGFRGTVAFSCAGLPRGAACMFSPNSVTLTGPQNAALSITTTAPTTAMIRILCTSFALYLPLFGMLTIEKDKKRKGAALAVGVLLLLTAGLLFQAGCGGSSTSGSTSNSAPRPAPAQNSTPAGTYMLTIVASSGSLQHTAPVRLTVQ